MQVTSARPKKFCKLKQNLPLPIQVNKDNTIKKIKGTFNGFSVLIEDNIKNMQSVISMGYFGKANFSRSYPYINKSEIIRFRQYERRKQWNTNSITKVIVVPDSDEESDDYFNNLKPEYQIDKSGTKETVWMSLEESFYLMHVVECLLVYYQNKILNSLEMWKMYSETDPHFPFNYIAYYYFKARNWVVKPGIKFGGDYLLYKQGPPFYHASYVVLIDCVNQEFERINKYSRSMDNTSLAGLNRLCETAGKEFLICQIILPDNQEINYNNMQNILIKEILMKRWSCTQED